MSRRVRDWCDICRDTEPDIKCVSEGCGRKFHESCLRTLNLWEPGSNREAYICADCTAANVNDGTCYVCKRELYSPPNTKLAPNGVTTEEEDENGDVSVEEEIVERRSKRGRLLTSTSAAARPAAVVEQQSNQRQLTREEAESIEGILLCDGCSNSAHICCVRFGDEAEVDREDDELWFCSDCDPHGETARQMTENKQRTIKRLEGSPASSSGHQQTSRTKIGGNVDICYVCQKGGKLLGCDFCEQSYHPRCIDSEYLEFEKTQAVADDAEVATEKWRCPLCKGEDPLKSMSTRRLSRTAMLRMQREMQKCIQQQHRISKANRDRFLWNSRNAMKPFMMEKAMTRLNKLFGKRKKRGGSNEDGDETEEETVTGQPASSALETLEREAVEAYRLAMRSARKNHLTSYTINGNLLKAGISLKPYQIVGVGWLLHSFFNKAGAILADEMGLGKTVQCLAFISALKAMRITGPHLIVVPLSTVGNWAREIRRFVPHLKFVKICGSRFERDHIMADVVASQGLHDLYITTYETVVTEESFFCDNFDWQCIILDEAHRIKNESGRIRHSLDRVCANMRVLLTGTPLQNNVKELFTLLNFMFPEILEHSDQFEKAFLTQAPNAGGDDAQNATDAIDLDKCVMDALFHLLSKMMLRRTKDLVVRLPKKIEHDLWLPLSPTSAYWYKQLLDVSEAAFESQSVRKLLGTVIKMRICTCHPKGLVSRDAQLTKFKELFQSLDAAAAESHNGGRRFKELEEKAEELKKLKDKEHVLASSKLVVLDKLLMQLHVQNLTECSSYRRAYEQNVKDLFVQNNPLPAIPVPKAKPKRRVNAKKSQEDVSAAPTEPGPDVEGEPATTSTIEPTARQTAEKARRERAALMSQQQRELDEKCDEAVATMIAECLQHTDASLEWLRTAMLPGEVSDAPIPIVKALLEKDEEDDDDDDDTDDDDEENNTDGNATEEDELGEDVPMEDDEGSVIDNEATPQQNVNDEDMPVIKSSSVTPLAESNASGLMSSASSVHEDTEDENATSSVLAAAKAAATEKSPSRQTLLTDDKSSPTPPAKAVAEDVQPPPAAPKCVPHKVLVFTQFQLVLDELEEYCKFRGFKYLRLDGSTNKMIRELDIREFNSPDSCHLVYLICTRAGGVGINLITANHVLLYDEDWNPFMDLQAIDRAHRIGQKREVHVWKLVTEWTVEERMAFRRLQKLKLDKLFIQSNTMNCSTSDEVTAAQNAANDDEHNTEKFSVDEIKRLIRYGREAIKSLVKDESVAADTKPGPNDLPLLSLNDIMGRTRQKLPDFADLKVESMAEGEDASLDVVLSGDEAVGEEEVELQVDDDGLLQGSSEPCNAATAAPCRVSTGSADDGTSADNNPGSATVLSEAEDRTVNTSSNEVDAPTAAAPTADEDFEEAKRSRRLRRRVTTVFGAAAGDAQTLQVPGGKGAAAAGAAPAVKERKILHDKRCFRCGCGNNAMDENADPLIACHRCPRVYHMRGCLGFDAPPRKTWVCQWHECSLCFRKGSQAGGMLIHCGECPTTFCFDCFPPEYKRWHPPALYFSELNRRGYHVSADKLVLFLCSRCKALKEQQRRRMLTKQQMDIEMRKRREVQEKARKDTQQRIKETIKETMKENSSDKDAAIALATALAKRGGDIKKNFLARKKVKDEQDKESLNNIKAAYQRLFPAEFITALKEKRAAQLAAKSEASAVVAEEVAAGGKLLVSKLPSEYCKVCDNCHLPGHELTHCPFPLEAVKKPDGAPVEPVNASTAPPAPVAVEDEEHSPKAAAAAPGTPVAATATPGAAAAAAAAAKRVMRSYCPKCGVSSRNHCRRHCDLLTDEDKEEYDSRKSKINQFVECLNNAPPAKLPPNAVCNVQNVESTRRFLQKHVDQIVKDCLKQAGLEVCVSTQQQSKLGRKKKRRASEESGGEESAYEDDDERKDNAGTLSPRKRPRTEGAGGGAESDPPSGAEDSKTRPRRSVAKPNASPPEEDASAVAGGGSQQPQGARKKQKASAAQPPIAFPVPPAAANSLAQASAQVVPASQAPPMPRMSSPPITAFLNPRAAPANLMTHATPQSYLPPGSVAARQQQQQQTMAMAPPPFWPTPAYPFPGMHASVQRPGWPTYAPQNPGQAFAFGMPPGTIPGAPPPPNGTPMLYGWNPAAAAVAAAHRAPLNMPPQQTGGLNFPPMRQVGLNQHGLQQQQQQQQPQ